METVLWQIQEYSYNKSRNFVGRSNPTKHPGPLQDKKNKPSSPHAKTKSKPLTQRSTATTAFAAKAVTITAHIRRLCRKGRTMRVQISVGRVTGTAAV